MTNEVELMELELEYKKVLVGLDSLRLDILKKQKDIERIEKSCLIQEEKANELSDKLKALKGE